EPKFGDILGTELGKMQAVLGCSRGRKYIFRSQSLFSFIHTILDNILIFPILVIAVLLYFFLLYLGLFNSGTPSPPQSPTQPPLPPPPPPLPQEVASIV